MRKCTHVTGAVLMLSLALAVGPGAAFAQKATSIKKVEFHGSPAGPGPEIVVTGSEFGKTPPKSYEDKCAGATGRDYGNPVGAKSAFGLIEDTREWVAGYGNASSSACIGILLKSWSNTTIVFRLGNAYEAYSSAGNGLEPGDNFVVQVKAAFFGGVVSYT
jgi:hypothetical protein